MLITNDYLHLKMCRYGWMMFNTHDKPIGKSLDIYGEWAQPEMDLLKQFIDFGNYIVDIGAHVGSHTLFFGNQVGSKGRVYAIEPQRLIFQMLCGNCALNLLQSAYPLQVAVGKTLSKTFIPSMNPHIDFNFGNIRNVDNPAGDPVPLITLDSLDLPACDLIKIDIEGAESDALEGGLGTISRYKPIIYFENNLRTLQPILHNLNYRCYWHTYHNFNPNNFNKQTENRFSTESIVTNMLCIPDTLSPDKYDLRVLTPV